MLLCQMPTDRFLDRKLGIWHTLDILGCHGQQPCPYEVIDIYCIKILKFTVFFKILDITANGLSPLEHGANATNWNFGQSFLFTVTIVTTIGESTFT